MLNHNILQISQQPQVEAMFMKHYKEWCLLSYSYMEDMSEAEDMVQDVFVKILNRKKTTEILDLKSYISMAVRNTSLKKVQRTKKTEQIKDYSLAALSPSHEEFLIDFENKAKINDALNILPEQSKRVFELCVFEGAKYQNAAEALGISINTVKFHLKKSFKILRITLLNTYF
ncbi:sigma-70 family RNA polymerase sigma factor [Flavivirga amylovorans]|uniref:Sigma-70 family RNA polymerase sigma factor n=1 Tax=Flavivirga amylovorans TaxID=870486 RepID=A0ABT8X282_9FLAO|nr:sigma-70 family RNA polymerase sigma factor [Flavivirga amylovorans]MDO5988067.1 sigma-70 family RNA polymerase sigma factor [Flavivirga amylovorans]